MGDQTKEEIDILIKNLSTILSPNSNLIHS